VGALEPNRLVAAWLTRPSSGHLSSRELFSWFLYPSAGAESGIAWSVPYLRVIGCVVDQLDPQLRAIPTVGFSDPILSYLSFLRYNFDGIRMLREGYEKVITSG